MHAHTDPTTLTELTTEFQSPSPWSHCKDLSHVAATQDSTAPTAHAAATCCVTTALCQHGQNQTGCVPLSLETGISNPLIWSSGCHFLYPCDISCFNSVTPLVPLGLDTSAGGAAGWSAVCTAASAAPKGARSSTTGATFFRPIRTNGEKLVLTATFLPHCLSNEIIQIVRYVQSPREHHIHSQVWKIIWNTTP